MEEAGHKFNEWAVQVKLQRNKGPRSLAAISPGQGDDAHTVS